MTEQAPQLSEQETEFIRLIADGETMRSAAKQLGVSAALLCKWLADPQKAELREQYARAREAQGDAYADAVVDVANDPDLDAAEKRVRMDAYKWAAGKRKPKVYGDKQQVEHSGSLEVKEAAADEAKRKLAAVLGAGSGARVAEQPID